MGWLPARALTGEPAGALPDRPGALGQPAALAVGVVGDPRRGLGSYVDDLWFNPVMSWFRGHLAAAMHDLAAGAAAFSRPWSGGSRLPPGNQGAVFDSGRSGAGHARTDSVTLSPYRQPMSAHPIMVRFKHALAGFRVACNSTRRAHETNQDSLCLVVTVGR